MGREDSSSASWAHISLNASFKSTLRNTSIITYFNAFAVERFLKKIQYWPNVYSANLLNEV